jgi:hypothetical protein
VSRQAPCLSTACPLPHAHTAGFRNLQGVLLAPGIVIQLKLSIPAIGMNKEQFGILIGSDDGSTFTNVTLQARRK